MKLNLKSKAIVPLLLLMTECLAMMFFAQKAGANGFAMIWCWLCGFALVMISGKGITQLFRCKPKTVATGLVQQIVLGMGAFSVATVLASWVHIPLLVWLPVVLAAIPLWKNRKQIKISLTGFLVWAAVFWGAIALVYSIYALGFSNPQAVGAITPNQDFFWNLGNIQSFLNGFPPQDLRFSGVVLQYHYLTELLYAGLTFASGLPAYDIAAFYAVPLFLGMAVCVLVCLANTLFCTVVQKCLCVAGLFVFGCAGLHRLFENGISPFWNNQIQHLLTNINAQTTTVILLAAFAVLYHQNTVQGFSVKSPLFWTNVLAVLLLCFAKAPVAGIVVLASACAALILFLQKRAEKQMLLFSVLILAVFAVLYVTFFSAGASQSMELNLWGTLEKSWFVNYVSLIKTKFLGMAWVFFPIFCILQTALYCLPAFVGWLIGIPKQMKQLFCKQISGETLMWNAAAAGGFLAFFLFDHYAMSQIYFGFVGLFFMGLCAIQNCSRQKSRLLRGCMILLCAVSATTGLITYGFLMKNGLQYLPQGAWQKIAEQREENRLPLLAEEQQAMNFLARKMQNGEFFATNRNHTGSALEGLSNVYSALSGKQAYFESFKYTVSNMGVSMEEVENRLSWNDALFSDRTTTEQAKQLCAEKGVRYIVYRQDSPGSEQPFLKMPCIFAADKIRIYDAME